MDFMDSFLKSFEICIKVCEIGILVYRRKILERTNHVYFENFENFNLSLGENPCFC